MQSTRKLSEKQLQQLHFFLDIVTDGSEHTGLGATFLTITRGSQQQNNGSSSKAGIEDKTVLARYALSGLPTLTSRLAADQSFKLSPVRAVFCPIFDVSTTAGIPSLLFALSNYSLTGQLNIVGPSGIGKYTDEMVSLILGRRKVYPTVLNCEIPSRFDEDTGQTNDCWWRVYEDEYIFVHARKYFFTESKNVTNDDGVHNADQYLKDVSLSKAVYIFTVKGPNHSCRSFAVIPPNIKFHPSINMFDSLPEDIIGKKNEKPVLDFILHIDPCSKDCNAFMMEVSEEIENFASRHFAILPNHDKMDGDLLFRATYQSKILNQAMPFAFPLNKTLKSSNLEKNASDSKPKAKMVLGKLKTVDFTVLRSCSSVSLDFMNNNSDTESFFTFSRRKEILGKVKKISSDQPFKCSLTDELKNYYVKDEACAKMNNNLDDNEIDLSESEYEENPSTAVMPTIDENEIDLSESESDVSETQSEIQPTKRQRLEHIILESPEHTKKNDPLLIVLGTGCASPSPLRGSSGYALMLPTTCYCKRELAFKQHQLLIALLDCGEGALLTLFRHYPKEVDVSYSDLKILESLRLVWISHAHLDHYSELPLLISLMSKLRTISSLCSCYDGYQKQQLHIRTVKSINNDESPRCKNCGKILPLLVIAPPKVLNFLDIATKCKHGIIATHENKSVRLFFGVSNRDFDHSPFATQLRDDLFRFELRRQIPDPNNAPKGLIPQNTYCPFIFFKSVPVEHCPNAYALVIGLRIPNFDSHTNNFSTFHLCYSGDTRPSQNIVRACQQLCSQPFGDKHISMLVHEVSFISSYKVKILIIFCQFKTESILFQATFDDDERGKREAISKKHSTVKEAISIAQQINAKVCLLTHFSQRYPKFPPGYKSFALEKEEQEATISESVGETLGDFISLSVGSAVDGMHIPLDSDNLPSIVSMLSIKTLQLLDEIHST